MFISFKDVPVVVTLEEFTPTLQNNPFYGNFTGYSFAAESVNVTRDSSTNFYFEEKSPLLGNSWPYKNHNKASASEGPTTTIDISYYMSVPEEAIFFIAMAPSFRSLKSNCVAYHNQNLSDEYVTDKDLSNEVMKKYTLAFGSGIFQRSYLKSYSFEVTPNNIIKSNISFISYSPFSGYNANFIPNLQNLGVGNTYKINTANNSQRNWCPAENFNFKLFEKHITGISDNKIVDSISGNLLKYNYIYKADIQPVYRFTERYPYRVIYNKEEISMEVDIDYQNFSILDPLFYTYKVQMEINNFSDSILQPRGGGSNIHYGNCFLELESGALVTRQANVRNNDIVNNRFSLKYYV